MTRRELLRLLALTSPGAAAGPPWVTRLTDVALARSASPSDTPGSAARLTPHQDRTVAEIAELIIPQTDTAGAKAAAVNRFIDTVIADADGAERDRFLQGLDWIDARAREQYGTDFLTSSPGQRSAILTAMSGATAGAPAVALDFFKSIKALTITGYYTSKIGMREELGDDGRTAFADYAGCTHPEHKVSA